MEILKIKVGTLTLTEARNVEMPQECAAWYQTVRVEPGTYDVFAYLTWSDGELRVRSLSASCEGPTVSSNFRVQKERTTAYIELPTYGVVTAPSPLLAQATLCDAIVRIEWDPREDDPGSTTGRMWRFTWNKEKRPVVIQQPRYGGGTSLAAFEDYRKFVIDGVKMTPEEVTRLNLSFQHLYGIDQFAVGETATGWSFADPRPRQVTRLA